MNLTNKLLSDLSTEWMKIQLYFHPTITEALKLAPRQSSKNTCNRRNRLTFLLLQPKNVSLWLLTLNSASVTSTSKVCTAATLLLLIRNTINTATHQEQTFKYKFLFLLIIAFCTICCGHHVTCLCESP